MTTNPPPGNFEERLPRGSRDPLDYAFVRPTGSPDDARTLGDWVAYVLTLAASLAPSALLDAIKTVDGSGSGLDADLLDGQSSGAFASAGHVHTASVITNTPSGNIAATTVQAALNELDTEKAALAGATFTGNPIVANTAPGIVLSDTDDAVFHRLLGSSSGYLLIGADYTNAGASTRIIFSIDNATVGQWFSTGGLNIGSPTGGDKGAGTLNAVAVYDDNTLLTCMAMAEKFLETGEFTDDDVAEWDARVPDQIEPARTEQVPVMDKVPSRQIVRDDDGSLKVAIVETERQRTEPVPLYDIDGKTGVDMIEAPVFEVVEIPERVIPRTHAAARVFKAMIDDGFDPRDPAAYIRKMRADEALPGMPTKKDWQHNALSSGEMMSRLWLATELLALAFATLAERVAALEAR